MCKMLGIQEREIIGCLLALQKKNSVPFIYVFELLYNIEKIIESTHYFLVVHEMQSLCVKTPELHLSSTR